MRVGVILGFLSLIVLTGLFGCDEDSSGPLIQVGPNVLHQGPDPGTLLTLEYGFLDENSVYVQFGDPQGFEDLATAVLSYDGVRVVEITGRDFIYPNATSCSGSAPDYEVDLDFDLLAALADGLAGESGMVVDHQGGFVDLSRHFWFNEYRTLLDTEAFTSASDGLIEAERNNCAASFLRLVAIPPLSAAPREIVITRCLFEFQNLQLEIFDAAGHSVVAQWPALRLLYQNPAEAP